MRTEKKRYVSLHTSAAV